MIPDGGDPAAFVAFEISFVQGFHCQQCTDSTGLSVFSACGVKVLSHISTLADIASGISSGVGNESLSGFGTVSTIVDCFLSHPHYHRHLFLGRAGGYETKTESRDHPLSRWM